MLRSLRKKIVEASLSANELARIDQAPLHLNSAGIDEWGLDPDTIKTAAAVCKLLYRNYFRVECSGIENIPQGRCLLIANHSGQIPIDAMLILMSLILDGKPPRIVRGMVERWVPTLPFVSAFFMRLGQLVGDQHNGKDMLNRNETVLVFPEGTRGCGKTYFERYTLKRFGTGFVRLALETKTPIVPVAVIGCEETYPGLVKLDKIAKYFGAPYFPVTPFFPWLGFLGMVPLPAKVTIRYGDPIYFEGEPDMPEVEVQKMVDRVKNAIMKEFEIGLEKRGDHVFTKAAL